MLKQQSSLTFNCCAISSWFKKVALILIGACFGGQLFFAQIPWPCLLSPLILMIGVPQAMAASEPLPEPGVPAHPKAPVVPEPILPPGVNINLELLIRPQHPAPPRIPQLPPKYAPPTAPEPAETFMQKTGQFIDDIHEGISDRLTDYATWIDSFFRDDVQGVEENSTYARLSTNFSLEEDESEVEVRVRIRLVLPELKNRVHLIISGSEDENDEDSFSSARTLKTQTAIDEKNKSSFTASLRYFFKNTLNDNASMRIGLRIRNLEPVALVEPRYRTEITKTPWTARFTQSLKWFSDIGYQLATRFDLERELGDRFFFRSTAEGNWYEESQGYYYYVDNAIFQLFSLERVIEYQIVHSFRTYPHNQLAESIYRLKYRRRIWREWLYFEVAPQIAFKRENDYDICPGVFFKLDIILGPEKKYR